MRRILVAGNWKMHGSVEQTEALLGGLLERLPAQLPTDVLVCPTFVHLQAAASRLAGSPIALGAQNLAPGDSGAFTGEISGPMLKDIGCSHVLVGHSERRALYGEGDQAVADKFVAAQASGLIPVLCVGETLEEHEAGATEATVARQVGVVLEQAGVDAFAKAIVAYEPVWAIGTGKTATPEHAQTVHAYIRGIVAAQNAKVAGALKILYGGSVKAGNAAELFGMPDVDGGLVGGASLDAEQFAGIITAAA